MKKLITYGSEYGTAKAYATEFSRITDLPLMNYKDIDSLQDYDVVIHFGGLYAGGMKGLKKVIKQIGNNTKLIIVTVGLADVNDPKNIEGIRIPLSRQVPDSIMKRTTLFHLRGGINYKELNFKHKTMMALLYNKCKNLPEEKKTAEVKAMIETYNQVVNFVDFEALKPILKIIQG